MTAVERTRRALDRLGFGKAWNAIGEYARRGFDLDRIVYLGLDLMDGPQARVKVYFRHYDVSPAELDARMRISLQHEAGFLEDFCYALTGNAGAARPQPLVSNLTFTRSASTYPNPPRCTSRCGCTRRATAPYGTGSAPSWPAWAFPPAVTGRC